MADSVELSPTSFQYVPSRAFYIKEFKDKAGNVTPQPIRNKTFTLSKNTLGECIVSLSPWICTDSSTIKVTKVSNLVTINSGFTTYTEVNHVPRKKNEIYFNRELNYVQFYPTEADTTQQVVISFYAKEMNMLFASIIATQYDSRGRVIETLEEYLGKVRKYLDEFNDIGDASTMIASIQYNVDTMSKIYNIVKTQYPTLQTLSNTITDQIPLATSKSTELQNLINSSSTIINKIKSNDNPIFLIQASDLYWSEDEGYYIYELEHKLGSDNIIWSFIDDDGDELVNFGHNSSTDPTNVFVVANDEKVNITAIACSGWAGVGGA